jgi:hypothetical protein
MPTTQQRSIELDFFRGLVLLIIVVDHVGGSILSRFTLHSFAFNDAAEVFVFLGGLAAAHAYTSLEARRGVAAARQRFVRRTFEIYRAYLVTALLMLAASAAIDATGVFFPNTVTDDVERLLEAPLRTLLEIVFLARQPYLASVLPMYMAFALAVPLIVPRARRRPWRMLAASTVLWAASTLFCPWLPSATNAHWDFNPFAWQWVFVLGVLARCYPLHERLAGSHAGWMLSVTALTAVAAFAGMKLLGDGPALPPSFKQDLGWLRIANFVAIAWLAADMTRTGWIARIARRLPAVTAIGRDGLVAFIAGTVISLVVDSVLHATTDGLLDIPLGLAADAVAIAALVCVARLRQGRRTPRTAGARAAT